MTPGLRRLTKIANDSEVVHSRGSGHRLLFSLSWNRRSRWERAMVFKFAIVMIMSFALCGPALGQRARGSGGIGDRITQHWKSGNRPRQRRGITRRHCNQPRLLAPESVGHGHPRSATTCASDTGPAESNQAIQLSPGERACGFDHGSSPSTAAPRTPQRPRAPPRRVQSSLLFGVGRGVLEGERLLLAMYGLLREMMQVAPAGDESGPSPFGAADGPLCQSLPARYPASI
jgi:hypothetical protein